MLNSQFTIASFIGVIFIFALISNTQYKLNESNIKTYNLDTIPKFFDSKINSPQKTGDFVTAPEVMPIFKGSQTLTVNRSKKHKSKDKLMQYIYSKLDYPEIAKKHKIEGFVFVNFIVTKDGETRDVAITKSQNKVLSEAALKAVNCLTELEAPWIPGKQSGKDVSVYYTVLVEFSLAD
jgi:TonB family protein